MSRRSIFLGVLASIFLCIICFPFDFGIKSGNAIDSMMPSTVYGGLALFVMLLNPLLRRLKRTAALSRAEVATVLLLVLVACGIPCWNLGYIFPATCMYPYHCYRTIPSWQTHKILDYAPQGALCDLNVPHGEDLGLNGFISGLGELNDLVSPSEIPWSVWLDPFMFWGPVILSFLVAIFGLSVVFHRQWSDHEQLPYPIIQFASVLLPDDAGKCPPIIKNRMFIIGFIVTFLISLNNYLSLRFPDHCIPIQLCYDMVPFKNVLPHVWQGNAWTLFNPIIIFTVIGLAYFLPTEASFTMWVGPWIYCFLVGIFASYGISIRGGKTMDFSPELFIFTGGYFGLFLTILYTGRHFYWNTLKRALFLPVNEKIPGYAIFGMRLFVLSIIVFISLLGCMGIHWTVGIPYAFFTIMIYACVSRVLAETGAFSVGSYVYPCVFIWGIFGTAALGPKILLGLFLLSTMLVSTPGWMTMPFLNQGLKLAEGAQLPMKRSSRWGFIVTILAIVITIPVTIYWQYNLGTTTALGWANISAQYPFSTAIEAIQKLQAQGLEDVALQRQGFDHVLNMQPDWGYLSFFFISAIIALIIAAGRLKFTWWPFHPIICIFFGSQQAMHMSFSFGIGFLLKVIITKYGGGKLYQKCKPFFVGLIAGVLSEGVVQMIIGTLYYVIVGERF